MLNINEKPKRILPSWIWENIKDIDFTSIYDPFCGTGTLAKFLKQQGKQVLTSDILQCFYWWNKAFIENNNVKLSKDIKENISKNTDNINIFEKWKDQYFTEEETNYLNNWFYNISTLELNDYERALCFAAIYLVINYWLSYNKKHISYPKPLKPLEVLDYYLDKVNEIVFSNELENVSYYSDAYELITQIPSDVIFIYPPSPEGFRNYDLRYYLCECWTQGVDQLNLEQLIKEEQNKKLGQTFTSLENYMQAINHFLELAENNPVWIIAYNDQTLLDRDTLINIVRRFRNIWKDTFTNIPYQSAAGTTIVKEGIIIAINE